MPSLIAGRPAPSLLALLSGLLLALAFPCHPDNPVAFLYGPAWGWVALAPLLLALRTCPAARPAFRLGWLAGFLFHLLSLYWIGYTQGGGPAVVAGAGLGAAYLGLFTGLFGVAAAALVRRIGDAALLAAPFLWVAMEDPLSVGELGFPWMLLGHSQAAAPALIQYASVTGVYGVSWAAALSAALLSVAVVCTDRARIVAAIAAVGVPAAAALQGTVAMAPEAAAGKATGGLRVAVVQSAMGLEKWRPGGLQTSLSVLEDASRRALDDEPDLVVWPETAVPCNLSRRPDCRSALHRIADSLGVAVLTGAPSVDADTGEPLNSAFLFQPGRRQVPTYAKMHLVPFGERTPLRDSIPFLRNVDWSVLTGDLAPAEFARGTERTLFELPGDEDGDDGPRFSVLICFESVFPDLVRRSVGTGADALVVITNDSWFGPTAGPYQHADIAVLRAVENRIAIARCATDGVSLFIDRFGRTRLHTTLGPPALRVGDVALRTQTTFYTRHGDLFAHACLALSALALVAARRRSRHG